MNLHTIVSGNIGAVNPHLPIKIKVSTGYTIGDGGVQVPQYAAEITRPGQIQALTYQDIVHLDSLSIQGTRRAIYVYGHVDGLVRPEKKGGDLITMPDGTVWLVATVLEQWGSSSRPEWCKLAVTLQNT